MNRSFHKWLAIAVSSLPLFIISATAANTKTTYTLEAGVFTTRQAADVKAAALRDQRFAPVSVDYNADQPGDYNYRVGIGIFDSVADANARKIQLNQTGLSLQVRGAFLYKESRIDDAIADKFPRRFIRPRKGKPVPREMTTAPLTGTYKILRDQVFEGRPTTAPESLAAYQEMIEAMPDNHPLKGREVLNFATLSFSGHSAYERNRPDYYELKKLLMKVATKQTSATTRQRRRARDLVIHITHYYDHHYVNAIRGYMQRIKAENKTHPASTAIARASLAGAIFEVSKTGGYPAGKTQDALYRLWQENVAEQDTALSSDTKQARDIRSATGRIGLMLSESYLEQKMWKEAEVVASSLVDVYLEYDDCWPVLAEAYCHLAEVGVELNDKALCFSSIDAAIAVSQETGAVWGDKNRDTLWKAYVWKYVISRNFGEPMEKSMRIKAQMIKVFPNHPGLKTFFGERVSDEIKN